MKIISFKTTLTFLLLTFAISGAQAQMEKEDLALDYSYIGSGNAEEYNEISFISALKSSLDAE